MWFRECDLVSSFVSINPVTLVQALKSPTRYLPHWSATMLPSIENCLWDKWDNTLKALKTVSGLFVWVTKWVSKTVNKKICCLWHAGKQAFISSIPGPIWLLTLQSISFIHACHSYGSTMLSTQVFFFFFLSEHLVSALGTQLDIRLLSSHSSCFHYCAFRRQLIFIIKVDYWRKGSE